MPPRSRRNNQRTRRRRFNGINLWNTAEAVVQANILTQNWMNASPLAVVLGSQGSAGSSNYSLGNMGVVGGVGIGIAELFGPAGPAARAAVWNNMKSTWGTVAIQSIGTRVGVAVAKRLTRGVRSQMNKGFKMVGLASEVRV